MKIIGGLIVGAFITGVFWVLYTATGDLIPSIFVTASVSIVVIGTSRSLEKRN